MNDVNIACLLACARTGNISYAAEELGLTYQTVSRNLQKLEDEFDCTLFVRDVQPLTLSEEGRILCAYLHGVDDRLQTVRRDYREERNGKPTFRIGFVDWSGVPTGAAEIIQSVESEMGVFAELCCGSEQFLEECMRREIIDAAIIPGFIHSPQLPPINMYEASIASTLPYRLCCSKTLLDVGGNIDYNRLSELPLYYSGNADTLNNPLLSIISDLFRRHGVMLPQAVQLPNFTSVIAETVLGNGFTVCACGLPEVARSERYLVQEEIPNSCIELKCIWRQNSSNLPLMKFISKVANK